MGDPFVRPHLMLAVAVPRPPRTPRRLEAQRRRNAVKDLWRERPAKAEQHASLVEIDPQRRLPCERAGRHLRRHMRKNRSDRSNAPAQPTDGARQGDVGPA